MHDAIGESFGNDYSRLKFRGSSKRWRFFNSHEMRARNRHTYVLRADRKRGADYTLPRGWGMAEVESGYILKERHVAIPVAFHANVVTKRISHHDELCQQWAAVCLL